MATALNAQEKSVVCLVVAMNKHAKQAFDLPHNSKYVHSPPDGQQNEAPPAKRQRTASASNAPFHRKILTVRLRRDHFRAPKKGLIFGSNDQLCDILLDENTNAGISEDHFTVTWNKNYPNPRAMQLVNHSSKGTTVEDTVLAVPDAKISLAQGTVVIVRVGRCKLLLKIMPNHKFTDRTVFTEEWRMTYEHDAEPPQAEGILAKPFPLTETMQVYGPEYRQRQIELKEIEKLLPAVANGKFGEVFECYFKEDMSPFALKTIKIEEYRRHVQLQREPEILRSLRHPHIVEYIAFAETKKEAEIYMEWAAHGDLHQFRNKGRNDYKGRIEESIVIEIAQQTLKALIYLQDMDIIHRDLKPKNILISSLKPLKVKLADFGLSKVLAGSPNILTSNLGTPGYVAPEILENGRALFDAMKSPGHTYNESVDIFALGATLLELLTGDNPFENESSIIELRRKIRMLDPTCLDRLTSRPRIASELIMRMVAADPEHRPSARECLNHPWLASSEPGPSQSGSSQPVSSQSESSQPGPSAIALIPGVASPISPAQNHQSNERYRSDLVSEHGAAASIPPHAVATVQHHSTQTSSSNESFDTLTASVIGRQYARNERHERRRTARAGG